MLATLKSDREESQRECKWKNLYIFFIIIIRSSWEIIFFAIFV